jgi:1,2-dihydroxy-3-keto-5-methylthiopentene dioxygenase
MSALTIYDDLSYQKKQMTEDIDQMTAQLAQKGIRFERWEAKALIEKESTQAEILEQYAQEVEQLKRENGFITADVVSLRADHPAKVELRKKFLDEHIHTEDEVRFFVFGEGAFYLHFSPEVWVVHCKQNDLLSVPANTKHWFDMGPEPNFTCIRFFNHPDGWVAQFTGHDIAQHIPKFEA